MKKKIFSSAVTSTALLAAAALFGSSAFAQSPRVPIKNVAVVETQIDEQSGAASEMSRAEVRVITDELRREAVNSLPRGRYNVMTAETVQSMGTAVLEECAEENCVIALGSKIGADYIVRGIISKFQDNYTLSVEMYETDYGMLVATATRVRTSTLNDLLEKTPVACEAMYKKFLETSPPASQQQASGERKPAEPKPEALPKPPGETSKTALWTAVTLDVIGAGMIAYGLIENGNVKKYDDKGDLRKAKDSTKGRNAAYAVGASALCAGITIHIFF